MRSIVLTRRRRRGPYAGSLALATILSMPACGGEGTLITTVYGEAFVESGIPAESFVDGWSVTFEQFLVVVGEVRADGVELEAGFRLVDLTTPSAGAGQELARAVAPAGEYSSLAYRVAPSPDAVAVGVDTEAAAMVHDAGYSLFVAGEAVRGGERIGFAWGFTTDTTYGSCAIAAEVEAAGEARAEITIHADHFFYDDLDSEEPNVVFDAIAAADAQGDGDGIVSEAELRAYDITAEARYQVGSRDISDLWGFIAAQTRNVGHVDGEGHCAEVF